MWATSHMTTCLESAADIWRDSATAGSVHWPDTCGGTAGRITARVLPCRLAPAGAPPATIRIVSQSVVDVACLCAAWCDLCGAYAPVFAQVTSELAASGLVVRRHWIDIEDDAELVGNVNVQTFPTVIVADAGNVRFAGPVTPQPDTLRRLLRATVVDARADSRWPAAPCEVLALAARLRDRRGSD